MYLLGSEIFIQIRPQISEWCTNKHKQTDAVDCTSFSVIRAWSYLLTPACGLLHWDL